MTAPIHATPTRIKQALAVFSEVHAENSTLVTELSPELLAALRREFGVEADAAASADDLARATAEWLAQDGRFGPEFRALMEGPAPAKMSVLVESSAVITSVLVVLQTHVKFERKPDGTWSLRVEKRPAADKLIGAVVSKLAGIFGK